MALVMGGAEKNEKTAAWGGFVGGLGLGVLILLSHLAIFSRIDTVADADLPMLAIINDISPILGYFHGVHSVRYDFQYGCQYVLCFRRTFHSYRYERV